MENKKPVVSELLRNLELDILYYWYNLDVELIYREENQIKRYKEFGYHDVLFTDIRDIMFYDVPNVANVLDISKDDTVKVESLIYNRKYK